MIEAMSAGLDPWVVSVLLAASFVASFITVALGIGGGALLLALMASLMPAAALIPVHGLVQLGSNAGRVAILIRHVFRPALAWFTAGSLIGATLGGSIVVDLPAWAIQIGVGAFVIYSVLATPPRWLSVWPGVTGAVSSFLTMFFGATGVFVANFTKSLSLPRQAHVATHGALMTVQHLLKVLVFGWLGFAFGPWIGLIAALIAAGFLGTLSGRMVLVRLSDRGFKRALDVVLLLISARLIWNGLRAVL